MGTFGSNLSKLLSYLKSAPLNLLDYKISQKFLILVFLGSNLSKLLSYLKSAPSNLPDYKISQKIKTSKFGTKIAYLGTFGPQFEKAIVISEISTLKFLKIELLTHIVNFGKGLFFLKVRDPVFLKVQFQVRIRFIKYAIKVFRNTRVLEDLQQGPSVVGCRSQSTFS